MTSLRQRTPPSARRPREAVGAAAEAEVLVAAPVAEVVARLFAGLRVVRDLVVPEAAGAERLVDREEGVGDRAVVGQRQAPAPRELAEARARLDRELVAER